MRTLAALLLLAAACHEPEDEPKPTSSVGATASGSAAASGAPVLEECTGMGASAKTSAAPKDRLDLSDIGEGAGIVRSSDPGFDRFAYGHDPRRPNLATIRAAAVSVTGRLPPEVVQRIVRQNFGRLRLCYQGLLAKEPTLSGHAGTSFTIDATGTVRGAKTTGDIEDAPTVLCIQRAFSTLSFPAPEGGTVNVVYPVVFGPPAYKFMIGDKHSIHVQIADVVKALEAAGYKVAGATTSSPTTSEVARFKAEKAGVTYSITFDPIAQLPLESYRKLAKEAVSLEDGTWGLFVESSDKAASQALIDAIQKKPEQQ